MPTHFGIKNTVYIQGKDGNVTDNTAIDELYQDICVRRLLATIIDERLGNNNWRKLHGLPMWRLR